MTTVRQRGVALVWVAITLVVLLGFVGLATDTAYLYLTAAQLQNAADAASLAGAQIVRMDIDLARQRAVTIGGANLAARQSVQLALNTENVAAGDVVVGDFDRDTGVFTPTLQGPNAVKVVARRTADSLNGTLPLIFAPAFGLDTANVVRSATAMVGGGTGAGVIALNPHEKQSLYVYGNATLTVNDGAIYVNSDHSAAAQLQGSATIDGPEINVQGDMRFVGGADYEGDLNTGTDPLPDPLAYLVAPNIGLPQTPTGITTSGTFDPGYYPLGISITGGDVTLNPGIYILDGAGLYIGGNATLTAVGVMFYIVGSGSVTYIGTGNVGLTPPDSGYYEGISIFQARDNTNPATITGTSFMDDPDNPGGTLYFPVAPIEVGGTGDIYINQLIADMITISGSGTKQIAYDGRYPAAGNTVFLVQ
jgi:Flp pilus assembly protein TadG